MGATGAVGDVGPTGVTGPTGPTGAAGLGAVFFYQVPGVIACFPPLSTEVTVVDLSVPVTAGHQIKLDYALSFEANTTANSSLTLETRLYRDGTLINARTSSNLSASAGTFRFTCSDTYVDIAPANDTSTYSVRIIVTTATNVTSASAINRSLNAIVF
jgi:hypothetical protein